MSFLARDIRRFDISVSIPSKPIVETTVFVFLTVVILRLSSDSCGPGYCSRLASWAETAANLLSLAAASQSSVRRAWPNLAQNRGLAQPGPMSTKTRHSPAENFETN